MEGKNPKHFTHSRTSTSTSKSNHTQCNAHSYKPVKSLGRWPRGVRRVVATNKRKTWKSNLFCTIAFKQYSWLCYVHTPTKWQNPTFGWSDSGVAILYNYNSHRMWRVRTGTVRYSHLQDWLRRKKKKTQCTSTMWYKMKTRKWGTGLTTLSMQELEEWQNVIRCGSKIILQH